MQYTTNYIARGGFRVEFVLQYRKLYCKSWLVWQWKGIVLQDYQVYCHRLVAKEVYCSITCKLKKIALQYTFVYCEQKGLGVEKCITIQFLYCDQQYP